MATVPTTESRLAALEARFEADPTTGKPVLKKEFLPMYLPQELADLRATLTGSTAGTAAPTPSPVVTGAQELLPAGFQTPFKLTGSEAKPYTLNVEKDALYNVVAKVADKGTGGGVGAQFVNPDGSGFGYKPLDNGTTAWQIKSPVTGPRTFAVQGNGGTSSITSVSVTKA
jgi:hypothetical protein